MSAPRDIAWRRLDVPGLELCRLRQEAPGAGGGAEGSMLLREAGGWAAFHWRLAWDSRGATRAAAVAPVLAGDSPVALDADGRGAWRDTGGPRPDLDGCLDADLGASPFTNTLQLRRLGLAPGQSAEIDVAWVPLPELVVRRMRQRYTCLSRSPGGAATWRFEDAAGNRVEGIRTDPEGLVTLYPELFERVHP